MNGEFDGRRSQTCTRVMRHYSEILLIAIDRAVIAMILII
jgi:hypothetical protein